MFFSEKSLKYSLSFKRRFQKNNDLGGFHLHLFYFAFVYQFYPRMTTLEDSVSKTREPPTPTPTPGIDYLLCFEKWKPNYLTISVMIPLIKAQEIFSIEKRKIFFFLFFSENIYISQGMR